jgi:tetratricopeptide (TPR) repeat protein
MWNNLGVAYTKKGMDEKALEAHKKSFEIDPGNNQAWGNLNFVANRMGRKEPMLEAPRLFQELQRYLAAQNYPAARKPAEQLVRLLPHYPDGHLTLGNILFYLKDTEGALKELNEAVRLKPDFAVAHVNLGHIYRFKGDRAAARASYQTALSIDPTNAEAKAALSALGGLGSIPPS